MNTKSCFAPAHILLPSEQIPLEKWGCIACDQFTSGRAGCVSLAISSRSAMKSGS